MKLKFHQFFHLNDAEIREIWDVGVFAFDANVLLNFYRYSEATVDRFSEIIRQLGSRVWLPHQVGKEFHERRLDVIGSQVKIYTTTSTEVSNLLNTFLSKDRSPFLPPSLMTQLSEVSGRVKEELANKKEVAEGLFTNDTILDKIAGLFEGKVGDGYKSERLGEIYSDGERRYNEKIPPGFSDKDKPKPNKFGDLIIWLQLIDRSNQLKKPIIFVSDDRKVDWWLEASGKAMGALPALREEFRRRTSQNFHLYSPFRFLEYAGEYLSAPVDENTIEEVKDLVPYSRFEGSNVENIVLDVTLDTSSPNSNINDFIDWLTSEGYEAENVNLSRQKSRISIPLPNIPDLQRRVSKKILSIVDSYNLELVNITVRYEHN